MSIRVALDNLAFVSKVLDSSHIWQSGSCSFVFDQIRSAIRIQRIRGTSYGEYSLEKCFSRSSNLFNNMISFISHFEVFDVQCEIVLGKLQSVYKDQRVPASRCY